MAPNMAQQPLKLVKHRNYSEDLIRKQTLNRQLLEEEDTNTIINGNIKRFESTDVPDFIGGRDAERLFIGIRANSS